MLWFALVTLCSVSAWAGDGGATLHQPWAAAFDPASDSLLVSNVNGSPWAKDNNGFITEFACDGGVLAAKWVAGGDKNVTLHAPKGIAVIGARVYVADLDLVRIFERKTGAPAGDLKVLGASSIEGLVAFGARLYAIDSGFHLAADGGLESTGTDGVYAIETLGAKPALKTLVKSRGLRHPRNAAVTATALYVASSTEPLLFVFDLTGRMTADPVELPHVVTGGVVVKENQLWFASSHGVLHGRVNGDEWYRVSRLMSGPGSMAFDETGNRLWVPGPAQNEVVEVPLPPFTSTPGQSR